MQFCVYLVPNWVLLFSCSAPSLIQFNSYARATDRKPDKQKCAAYKDMEYIAKLLCSRVTIEECGATPIFNFFSGIQHAIGRC